MNIRLGTGAITVMLLLALLATGGPARAAAQEAESPSETLRVALFIPTSEDNTYWPEVVRVMQAAEAELKIALTVHEFDVGDRFAKADEGVRILQTEPVPDGAIFSVAYGQAQPLMDVAEERGIPFMLHGPLFPAELDALGGGPRRKYEQWIGYFHEDEEEKGYLLARELITAAIAANPRRTDHPIRLVGVSGDPTWYGTVLREAGLRRAVAHEPRAQLLQVVPTRWTQQEGRDMTERLMYRYPNLTVVWTASDQLALGAYDALRSAGRRPGIDTFTGGLDLSRVGREAVHEGRLTATVAAPIRMWSRVLHYLTDYLRGGDFADSAGTEILFAPVVATPATVDSISRRR